MLQDEPVERPYLKKALRDICYEYCVPIDEKSDEVFTEHCKSEFTEDLSCDDSLMSFRSDAEEED